MLPVRPLLMRRISSSHNALVTRLKSSHPFPVLRAPPRRPSPSFVSNHRYALALAAAALIAGYTAALDRVPVTGRTRAIIVPRRLEKAISQSTFRSVMENYGPALLPSWHPLVRRVSRISKRLVEAIGMSETWSEHGVRVYVIDEPVVNAFVIPTGEIFVFTGIMPLIDDDDELAALLGHEIAHVYARHTSEQLSLQGIIGIGTLMLSLLLGGGDTGLIPHRLASVLISRKFSRNMESEADEIGTRIAASACFDPRAATAFMRKLCSHEGKMSNVQEFLSTHPSGQARQERLSQVMPAAYQVFQDADCESLRPSLRGFVRRAFNYS